MNTTELQNLKQKYRIVGRDQALDVALSTSVQVARTDLSVFIQGESGVGKEIIPRIIHDHSTRKQKKYIAINCGSIPEGTIDSELFGHKKGSYTGALEDREGYFGVANGGTLFMDEVGELPLSTQARLLRVLETGEYIRVGESEPRKTDVRIVAATNMDMPSAIREGRFREDLFYRLCTIYVKMPPLRERGIDVVLLFKKFALDTAAKFQIPEPLRLLPEAEQVLRSYKWPGNIRQLKNVVEQMSILCTERVVSSDALAKFGVVANVGEATDIITTGAPHNTTARDYEHELNMLMNAVIELRKDVDALKQLVNASALMSSQHSLPAPTTLPATVHPAVATVPATNTISHPESTHIPEVEDIQPEEVVDEETLNLTDTEKRNIEKSLKRNHYNRKKAALELGISERTLYRKIKDYEIEA